MIPHGLSALLRAVARRRQTRAMLTGAAAGGLAALCIAALLPAEVALGARLALWGVLAAAGGLAQWARLGRTTRADADAIEQAAPNAQNLVRTAVELVEQGAMSPITERVWRDADARVRGVRGASVVPLRRAGMLALLPLLGVMLWALWRPIVRDLDPWLPAVLRGAPSLSALTVRLEPPAYTGRGTESLALPREVIVLSGSTLSLRGRLDAAAVVVTHLGGVDTLWAEALEQAAGFVVAADELVTLTPLARDGTEGARHVIAVRVRDDAPPVVRILTPARDLRVPDGDRQLALTIEANDDIALADLRVRFTRVRGAGEQFAFVEGDATLDLTRDQREQWRARATLRLDTLRLEPGDVVVYRAIARDGRPGTSPSESETFLVEVTAPGSEAVEGFAADDDQDRYGLSQAMVILKTERLLAAAATVSPEELRRSALSLAAEQRSVRAEFVFMMGGELADDANDHVGHLHLNEEAEAEAEDDILAGRLANQGRLEMTRAIRAMSTAAQLLTAGTLAEALTEERRALAALERALARSRFILRALSTRERVDPARRLTGTMAGVTSSSRPAAPAADSGPTAALRHAATLVQTLHAQDGMTLSQAQEVARRAQGLLAAFPRDSAVRATAEAMLRDLHPDVEPAQRRATSSRVLVDLAGIVRARLPWGAGAPAPVGWRAIGGER